MTVIKLVGPWLLAVVCLTMVTFTLYQFYLLGHEIMAACKNWRQFKRDLKVAREDSGNK